MKKYFMIILICFVCCSCSVTKEEFYKGEYLCRDNGGLNKIYYYGPGLTVLDVKCNDGEYNSLNKINYNDYIEYLKKTQSPKAE